MKQSHAFGRSEVTTHNKAFSKGVSRKQSVIEASYVIIKRRVLILNQQLSDDSAIASCL